MQSLRIPSRVVQCLQCALVQAGTSFHPTVCWVERIRFRSCQLHPNLLPLADYCLCKVNGKLKVGSMQLASCMGCSPLQKNKH